MHESEATARATHNRRKEENSIVPSSYSPDTGNIGRTLIEEGSRENTHDSTIPTCGSNDAPQGSCRQFSQFPCDNKEDPSVTAWRPSTRPGVRCPKCPKECTACRRTLEVKVQERSHNTVASVTFTYAHFPSFPAHKCAYASYHDTLRTWSWDRWPPSRDVPSGRPLGSEWLNPQELGPVTQPPFSSKED